VEPTRAQADRRRIAASSQASAAHEVDQGVNASGPRSPRTRHQADRCSSVYPKPSAPTSRVSRFPPSPPVRERLRTTNGRGDIPGFIGDVLYRLATGVTVVGDRYASPYPNKAVANDVSKQQ